MNNFQTILVAVFLGAFVFGVLIFSGAINIGPKDVNEAGGKVVIWGLFPRDAMYSAVNGVASLYNNLNVKYESKDISTYQQELIEAFAKGKAPDLFIITPDMIRENSSFIYKIPYNSFPRKSFTDSYIDGANIYLDNDGVLGYPILVDPIVLYYNKDILLNRNIVYPPKTWDELFTLNPSLTKNDNYGAISESMIALGGYKNINNAKDILATLLIQNDNNIVNRDGDVYKSVLRSNLKNLSVSPAYAVIAFFNEFSNQSKTAYSWNSSLPNSLDMFTSSKLAFYIGKASELFNIESINPNLSFNVEQIPQVKDSKVKSTFGDIYAVVINNKSTNLDSAFKVASSLASDDISKKISIGMSLPPVSRSLLNDKPKDNQYLYTFFNNALIAKSWNDPDDVKTNSIFKEMIEDVLSNSLSINESINKAEEALNTLLK